MEIIMNEEFLKLINLVKKKPITIEDMIFSEIGRQINLEILKEVNDLCKNKTITKNSGGLSTNSLINSIMNPKSKNPHIIRTLLKSDFLKSIDELYAYFVTISSLLMSGMNKMPNIEEFQFEFKNIQKVQVTHYQSLYKNLRCKLEDFENMGYDWDTPIIFVQSFHKIKQDLQQIISDLEERILCLKLINTELVKYDTKLDKAYSIYCDSALYLLQIIRQLSSFFIHLRDAFIKLRDDM